MLRTADLLLRRRAGGMLAGALGVSDTCEEGGATDGEAGGKSTNCDRKRLSEEKGDEIHVAYQ